MCSSIIEMFILHPGMLIGGYSWGSLADVFGRKRTLMTAMLFNGICGLLSSLSPNFLFFLFFRLASGIGYVILSMKYPLTLCTHLQHCQNLAASYQT